MINGFLLINKTKGVSSFKVVHILKKKFNLKKVGHLGTLDPMATGLLIIAINKATKFASLMLESEKSYRAEITLGIQTDTDDLEGEVILRKEITSNNSDVKKKLLSFIGESSQIPPDFSALKYKGKPMYKYARDGVKIKKKARKIIIKRISNISVDIPRVSFDIECSKGTYIRSIARDLGIKLGCGGYLSKLIRTSQKNFLLSDACSIDDITMNHLISLENAFNDLNSIHLNKEDCFKFINGRLIEPDIKHNNLLKVYDASNQFIAIGRNTRKGFKHEYLV